MNLDHMILHRLTGNSLVIHYNNVPGGSIEPSKAKRNAPNSLRNRNNACGFLAMRLFPETDERTLGSCCSDSRFTTCMKIMENYGLSGL